MAEFHEAAFADGATPFNNRGSKSIIAPPCTLIVTHIFGWTQGVSEYEVR
jgi:hypothetical protein